MKTAFISVSNKEGLVDVARVLINLDTRLIASKGTAAFLSENKIEVLSIEDYLNISPILDSPSQIADIKKLARIHVIAGRSILTDSSQILESSTLTSCRG